MTTANNIACVISAGVTAKANATWLNDWKFIVDVRYPSKTSHDSTPPSRPPTSASAADSAMTEATIETAPNGVSVGRVMSMPVVVAVAVVVAALGAALKDSDVEVPPSA